VNDDFIFQARRLPARLDSGQTAALLGFAAHDMPVLVKARLLRPLGNPSPNSPKYFARIEIEQNAANRDWLDKATKAVTRYWHAKNQNKNEKGTG